jgi:serine/threonine protein kinase
MLLHTRARLGPYEILAPIGAGGMGVVYRAHDPRLERQVAIKVLPGHLSQSPQALARFVRETKAIAALSHPNILAIFDTGVEDGISYAVTELLEGESLRASLRRGPLAWRRAAEIGIAFAFRQSFQASTPCFSLAKCVGFAIPLAYRKAPDC